MSVVLVNELHTSPIKEMMIMNAEDKKTKHSITCKGDRKQPSKEALDRFISIFLDVVKENEKKLKGGIELDSSRN